MRVHIKSADLCARCRYNFCRHCSEEAQGNCFICVMNDIVDCKCLGIKPNTPCPYFEEVKDNG